MAYGLVASIIKTKATTGIAGFVSGIFTKSRYAKWKGKGWERFVSQYHEKKAKQGIPTQKVLRWKGIVGHYPWDVCFLVEGAPLPRASLNPAKKTLMSLVSGWNKDMKEDIRKHLATIKPKPDPPPKPPTEVHKVSASYKSEAKTQTTAEPRLFQAGISKIPKIPLYVLIGAGALFLIFNLTKTKGGAG